jgi:hypothetical protein
MAQKPRIAHPIKSSDSNLDQQNFFDFRFRPTYFIEEPSQVSSVSFDVALPFSVFLSTLENMSRDFRFLSSPALFQITF